MPNPARLHYVEFDNQYAVAAVKMWRESKQRAIGIEEIHSFEDHLYFLNEILAKENQIYLAIIEGSDDVAGLIATDGTWVNQLYVHNDFQRMGIGTKLLEFAKGISSGRLRLYTFEVNCSAQAFYENHGFKLLRRGNDNEEQLPDMLYEWREKDGLKNEL
ncbi:MAG: GNAT family N-acetyltransferase [Pseudomonadota bacterium]